MTSIEPSPRPTIPVEDDFTDIELAELEDFGGHRGGNGGPGFEAASNTRTDTTIAPEPPPGPAGDGADDASPTTAQLHEANTIAAGLRSHADNLGQLDDAELTEHVEYYQQAHGALQRALSDIDSA